MLLCYHLIDIYKTLHPGHVEYSFLFDGGSSKRLHTILYSSLKVHNDETIYNFRYTYRCNKTILKGREDMGFRVMVTLSSERKGDGVKKPYG